MTMPISLQSDPRYQGKLIEFETPEQIPPHWKETPIEKLILAANFDTPIEASGKPELLIVTCIEFRYSLPVPKMYAYKIRRASGRLIGSEFSLAYVLSRGVRHLALVGHNDCGMAKVSEHRPAMIEALAEQGWNRERAEEFVGYHAMRYAIDDEMSSLEREYHRLKRLFKRVHIAPLMLCLEDSKLYLPKWYHEWYQTQVSTGKQPAIVPDEELLTVL